jgi:hypothetical protein
VTVALKKKNKPSHNVPNRYILLNSPFKGTFSG